MLAYTLVDLWIACVGGFLMRDAICVGGRWRFALAVCFLAVAVIPRTWLRQ